MNPFVDNSAFAVSAVVDALIVGTVVVWAARSRPRLGRLTGVAALAFGLLAVKGLLLIGAGLNVPLGVMHVMWLDLAVVTPFAAGLLGLLAWRAGTAGLRALVVLGLLMAPVGAYASFVEPSRLVVEHAQLDVPAARDGDDGFRIALLADIQFDQIGDHEREAIATLMAQHPDLILLAGDYIQATRAQFDAILPEARRLFGELHAPGGVFAVHGDAEGPRTARRLFEGTDVRVLVNETATTRIGDRTILLGGLQRSFWKPAAQTFAQRFERLPGEGDVRILLTHRPDIVLDLHPGTRIDLVAAGHTHGGQVQIPFFGPLRDASGVSREISGGGLHVLRGRAIYVSRGVGVERRQAPRLRFGAPPEISIIDVR
jgi:predicted MPP superfamily phosphohydrolase